MVENHGLWLKTMDYGQKLWILVENHGLWSKTADYGRKLWIMVKTMDFSQKLWILQFLSLKLQNCLLVSVQREDPKGKHVFSFLGGGFNP